MHQHQDAADGVSAYLQLEADLLATDVASPQIEPTSASTSSNGFTILVAGADADLRAYVGRCLTRLGSRVARVVEAADGQAALERARHAALDLIISDTVLSRLDGRALCRALHDDPALRQVPVLLITGERPPSVLPPGAHGVVTKPFNATKLLASVWRLLGP